MNPHSIGCSGSNWCLDETKSVRITCGWKRISPPTRSRLISIIGSNPFLAMASRLTWTYSRTAISQLYCKDRLLVATVSLWQYYRTVMVLLEFLTTIVAPNKTMGGPKIESVRRAHFSPDQIRFRRRREILE